MSAAKSEELLQICEALLVYCHLLVKSIERTSDEAIGLREIATHLKTVFDEESTRERQYITALGKYTPLLRELDKKYYALKNAAKNLIKEVQDDKDRFDQEYQKHLGEFQTLESQVYTARSISQQRDAELQTLNEAIGNGSSVSTLESLRAEVASLDKENRKLAAEARQLQAKVDEITHEHGSAGTAASIYVDSSRTTVLAEHNANEAKIAALESQATELTKQLRELKDNNTRLLARERGINHGMEEKCHELLGRVENEEEARN